jgi:hypothetical protein
MPHLDPEARKKYQRDYARAHYNSGENSARAAAWRPSDSERAKESVRTSFRKLRDEVILGYGGVCACCAETERLFLCLDHVNNNRAEHRRQVGTSGWGVYREAKTRGYPPDFQVLCFNCNNGKRVNGGVCPHQLA